jgi:hypothetical protein
MVLAQDLLIANQEAKVSPGRDQLVKDLPLLGIVVGTPSLLHLAYLILWNLMDLLM